MNAGLWFDRISVNSQFNPQKNRGSAPSGSVPPKLARKRSRPGRALGVFALLVVAGFVVLRALFDFRPSTDREWGHLPQNDDARIETPRQGGRPSESMDASRPTPSLKVKPEKVTGPRAAPPTFSKPGGICTEGLEVEVKAPSPSATIRYTMDGSEPSAASREYAGAIAIKDTTLLKVKSFEPGVAPSLTVARTFTMLDSNLADFTSTLPLVIINAFGQQITKPESINASLSIIDNGGNRTSLTGPSEFEGRCDIKLRGYSSLRLPKRSFTVKMRDDAGEPLNVPILGLPADSDWVLYAPYADKTLMRDVLAYELSNKMGRYAARTRLVEVFLNRQGNKLAKRDYLGVYVFEEKIKRGKDRVDIQELKAEDKTEPDITGGYIFKRDHSSPPMDGSFRFEENERGFHTGRGMHLFYVDPDEENITSAQKAWLSRHMNQFERALYGSGFKSPPDGYAKYLDIDSFIDQFWIVELSKNVDGFRYSCYMFKDRGGKIRVEPLWDWNLSFGNANYHQGWMPERWYWRQLRENEVSWMRRLSQDPEFMQRLADRWAELRSGLFAPENILHRIDELAAELQEAQARNFQRWPILGQSINPNWFVGDTFQEEVDWMKSWIQRRVAWIDSQFVAAPVLSSKRSKLEMKGSGTVYFTLDGSDPRLRGGEVSTKAQEYSEAISIPPGSQVIARAHTGEGWSGPAKFPPVSAPASVP